MVRLLLPLECQRQLIESLRAAGSREIGGVLMGEHVGTNVFRVRSLTVQTHGGAFSSFVRLLEQALQPLRTFFRVTNHDYRRFNYLGEWHSHPSFALAPSTVDLRTMREIVDDQEVGAPFAVLLIVKLVRDQTLAGAVTVFPAGQTDMPGELELEGELV